MRLQEKRNLVDGQETSHHDHRERRVGQDPAQGVEQPPNERASAAADLPADVRHRGIASILVIVAGTPA